MRDAASARDFLATLLVMALAASAIALTWCWRLSVRVVDLETQDRQLEGMICDVQSDCQQHAAWCRETMDAEARLGSREAKEIRHGDR